ncbi:DUF5000 domain-containing lipoprotein [Albibacterium indicum]|uniref:DUF5000 domain-containing lipoprotein n=1 Tax=Albibacterium indicum TaxID=2292082 RepID=UPI000E5132D5|nr:DUF5000 domain-containing lipoprotein [Pedobacter indicus]
MRFVYLFFSICLFGFFSCNERKLEPLVQKGDKPSIVSDISVKNDHGAATISYALPDDSELLYVEAEYTLDNGVTKKVKSSVFKGFVKLEGFTSTNEREVFLYTVNRSEMKSDPISVKIKPLISPIELAFNSLLPTQDFGGVNVKYDNELENEYVLYFLTKDSVGQWEIYDKLYTLSTEINPSFSFRGLGAEPQEFAFYFTDKWQNRSDTLFQTITPLYEVEIDKTLMKHYQLDNDYYVPKFATRQLKNLWDGPSTAAGSNFFLQEYTGFAFPWWFTIDLGKKYQIGRMKVFPSPAQSGTRYSYFFGNLTPRVFEIWGSNDPGIDGSWDSWTLLDRFESIKPSGLPMGENSAEDIAVGLAGEDFTFSNYEQAYRYIRVKVMDSWSSQAGFILQELTLWGAPVE